MDVADHVLAQESGQAAHAVAQDGGTQVAHMQRLGHVRAAEIHHDRLFFKRGQKQARIRRHIADKLRKKRVLQGQVNKSRRDGGDGGKAAVALQTTNHVTCDHKRRFTVLPSGGPWRRCTGTGTGRDDLTPLPGHIRWNSRPMQMLRIPALLKEV